MRVKTREREEFLVKICGEGVPLDVARKVCRNAATIQRLSEAKCNGDYPCDNGERKVGFCSKCESGYVPHVLDKRGVCPNCRASERIEKLLAPYNVKPIFQGDPRGACVKLAVPSGKTDDWGRTGICVPA